jgi:predicted aconitase with swiveling domain
MIVKDVETVLIVSAFIAKVPLVDKLERDPFGIIRNGDYVTVDADKGMVTIASRKG